MPKDKGLDFWREILMMAIGEILQEVVHVKKGMFTPPPHYVTALKLMEP